MVNPSRPNRSESIETGETIAPSGLNSKSSGSGPFSALPVQFGRFEVRKILGSGGMGSVYLAFDPTISLEVALKIPKFQADEEPLLLERFLREAQATSAMNHPNICSLFEVGEIGGTHFISMEYVEGRPLSDYIGPGQLQRRIVVLVRKLALALAHAHERGFIHRDLKPSNVIVGSDGAPRITDFGLARRIGLTGDIKLTQSNTIVGSPAYMSPEQARSENDRLTPASDIYSLGTLFFEMLTGELPFTGPLAVVLGKIAMQKAPKPSGIRPDVDPELEKLCLKMLEKKTQNRPGSMTEIADQLTEWVKREGASSEVSTRDAASQSESAGLVPLKPARNPGLEKVDPLEARKQRVNDLIEKKQFGPAIGLLEKMVNLRDPRLGVLVEWARPRLQETRAAEKQMQDASEPLCSAARQLLKAHDYVGAVQILEQVPAVYQSNDLQELLIKSLELRDECDRLFEDIDQAIQKGESDVLPALVKRLLHLKPGSKAARQLADELKKYGVRTVIVRRKQRRRFTADDRLFETRQIVWGAGLIAALFIGVSLMVWNYLLNARNSGELRPIVVKSGTTEPPVGDPIPTPAPPPPLQRLIPLSKPPAALYPSEPDFAKLDASLGWYLLDVASFEASAGTNFEKQPDGSILVTGANPINNSYTIKTRCPLKSISAVKLEVIPDDRLPGGGPGRSTNGNFVLNIFDVAAGTRKLKLADVVADYSQHDYPVASVLPSKTLPIGGYRSGWAPEAHQAGNRVPRAAVFQLETPADISSNEALTISLGSVMNFEGHTLGRFRLSVTGDPVNPRQYDPSGANRRLSESIVKAGGTVFVAGRGFCANIKEVSGIPLTHEFQLISASFERPAILPQSEMEDAGACTGLTSISCTAHVAGLPKLLEKIPRLVYLKMFHAEISVSLAQAINSSQQLHWVEFYNVDGPGALKIQFDQMPSLKKLNCTLNAEGYQSLTRCANLIDVSIRGSNAAAEVMKALATRDHLESLVVADNNSEQSSRLRVFPAFPKLQKLGFRNTLFDNMALDILRSTYPNLKELELHKSKVTPEGLPELAGFSKLIKLKLNYMNLKDADLNSLPVLPQLRELELMGNPITALGVQKLQQRMPDCTVVAGEWNRSEVYPSLRSGGKKGNPAAGLPPGHLDGVRVEIFDGSHFEFPRRTRIDFRIARHFKDNWPDATISEHYSARWAGNIKAPEPGRYQLAVAVNGCVTLSIDGKVQINRWFEQELTRHTSAEIEFEEKPKSLILEYGKTSPTDRSIALLWRKAGDVKFAIVPDDAFTHVSLTNEPVAAIPQNRLDVAAVVEKLDKNPVPQTPFELQTPSAYLIRGLGSMKARNWKAGNDDFVRALKYDVTETDAYNCNEAAWALAIDPESAARNSSLSIQLALNACRLTGFRNAEYVDTLAAAYADSGSYVLAVLREKEALQLPNSNSASAFQARLKNYQAN